MDTTTLLWTVTNSQLFGGMSVTVWSNWEDPPLKKLTPVKL